MMTPLIILILIKRFNLKKPLIIYSLMSLLIPGVLITFLAWWSVKSDMILLEHYGFNSNGWNETERLENVAPVNLEKVKRLESNIMGIGWPLKALFGYVFIIPYLIFVYIGKVIIDTAKKRKRGINQ